MPWRTRRNGARYFYESIRVNGATRDVYWGAGPEAQQRAAEIEAQKLHRRRATELTRTLRARSAAVRRANQQLKNQVTQAALAAGFQKRHGRWRTR
ncbi:hypothetical protein Pla175_28820 [Pirellulimonas nuda]|uniref:Uncharacterized protein n=1 Tax=Pirellulimonas nuda TaxID=2528009 RepID=A0A518DDD3_9BACT|nr:hypothetical protein [Pirellulimonas nuda]QDU89491.1 hypothetical protein Pla175_28820 [Pirellulimonas nuda]